MYFEIGGEAKYWDVDLGAALIVVLQWKKSPYLLGRIRAFLLLKQ